MRWVAPSSINIESSTRRFWVAASRTANARCSRRRVACNTQLPGKASSKASKLINLLALLLAFPGSWLLHATRRREQRALAVLEAATQNRRVDDSMLMLDGATQRMNRFFYRFGFACLGVALVVSWISTRF